MAWWTMKSCMVFQDWLLLVLEGGEKLRCRFVRVSGNLFWDFLYPNYVTSILPGIVHWWLISLHYSNVWVANHISRQYFRVSLLTERALKPWGNFLNMGLCFPCLFYPWTSCIYQIPCELTDQTFLYNYQVNSCAPIALPAPSSLVCQT